MKTKVLVAAVSSLFVFQSGFGQGALTPPGAPGPTMKSLDQIEPRVPINTLPGDSSDAYIISQPGSYYLTASVTVPGAASGIRILTNDVKIESRPDLAVGSWLDAASLGFGVSNATFKTGQTNQAEFYRIRADRPLTP